MLMISTEKTSHDCSPAPQYLYHALYCARIHHPAHCLCIDIAYGVFFLIVLLHERHIVVLPEFSLAPLRF